MKHLLISLLFISTIATAEEVRVTGYGTNYKLALDNAKVVALEKGASTFIIGETNAINNNITEKIDQYNGGIINKYDVVSHRCAPSGCEVTIVADVVPKNNAVRRNKSTTLNIDFDEYEQRERIVNRLDNVGRAIHAEVLNPSYKIGRHETTIYSRVVLSWQPKWITDVKSFATVLDDKGKTTNNVYDTVSGSVINGMMTNFGLIGAVVGMTANSVVKPEIPKNSDKMMICFSQLADAKFDCSNIAVDLSFPRNPKLVIVGKLNDRDVVLYEQYLDPTLYRYVSAGESVGTDGFIRTGFRTRFHNPALVVYEKQRQTVDLTFNVESSIIKSVTDVRVYLR